MSFQSEYTPADYRLVLQRVGVVLMVAGTLDIGLMIFCIYNGVRYNSSLNIFAVVAGFLLRRGSLQAARVVAWCAALELTGFAAMLLLFFSFAGPLDYWLIVTRLNPGVVAVQCAFFIVSTALLAWTYANLRSAVVLQARRNSGLSTSPPWVAILIGGVGLLVLGVFVAYLLTGDIPVRAIAAARGQYGDAYRYHVAAIHSSNGVVRVDVVAFNNDEIKTVRVRLGP